MEIRMKVRMLRTDRGGEFTSNEFTKYCKENGIARQLTAPYSPQQNGVVERRNRTVLSTTRRYLTRAWKLNLHMRHSTNKNRTWKPKKIGCTALCKDTITYLKKLDDRSIPMIYLGVEEGSKACRLYDPIAKKKHVSRDVKFMETKPWDWNKDKEDTEQDPINDPNSPITPSTYTYIPHSEEEEEATTSLTKNLENRFDHVPVRGFKDLAEIYQNTQEVETETLLFTEEEPRNYKEASTDKKWIEAMEIELDSINKNNTWTLTTLPPDQKAIGLKWVFKTKRDAKGNIIQLQASFARIETVRLILALAAHHGWQVHHLDVKSAFLHGDLKEEVYVTQPEGFVQQGNSGKVYKLTKALYGLRQAQVAWNRESLIYLKSLDL
ncbi:zinc finger, CCHC-type containing protein [Tanacetum coccineum]